MDKYLNISLASLNKTKANSGDIIVLSYRLLSFNIVHLYATVAPTRPPHHGYLHRTNPTSITLPRENLFFLRSFRALKFPARMLMKTSTNPSRVLKLFAPLFKNGHIRSSFACITKPIVINVEPLFLRR